MRKLFLLPLTLLSLTANAKYKESVDLWNLFNQKYQLVDISLQLYTLNFPKEERAAKIITDQKTILILTEKIKTEFITKLEEQFTEKEIQYFNNLFRNKNIEKFNSFTGNFGNDIGANVVKNYLSKPQK